MDRPCELCGKPLAPHAHYIVRIEVFADPSMPPTTTDALASTDFDSAIDNLIDQMKDLTEEDLQNQVHRHFEYRICGACQAKLLANPLGKPREKRSGQN